MRRLRRALWLDPGEYEDSKPTGEWWPLPTWRKLAIWIIWRPPTWIDWAQKTVRWKIANSLWRHFGRDLPGFRVTLLLGAGRGFEHEDKKWETFINAAIIEVHEGPPCSCAKNFTWDVGYPHHLSWDPWLGPLDSFGINHAKAYYTLERP